MATKTQELATTTSYAIMDTDPREVAEALREATGGQAVSPFDLDIIKVPSGQGAPMWMVPTPDGDTAVKSLDGVVIAQRTVRAYWSSGIEESGGGSPPDCSSQDGITGVGDPGGDCATCPFAQFGSDRSGRGQACKANLLLFTMTEDSVIPLVVKVPPSSIQPVRKFMLRLAGFRTPMWGAVVSLTLQKAKNAAGIDYFQIAPSLASRLSEQDAATMRRVKDELGPVLSAVTVDVERDVS